jgi:hypothetical protein
MTETVFTPNRAAGLAQMAAFTPAMGQHYASRRNYDLGPENRTTTSVLSPWLRRRLITEREVVTAALDAHGPRDAEKYVQEVFWRTYFKGWLEKRPSVWTAFQDGLSRAQGIKNPGIKSALAGTTGIECFDAWVHELIETGYLHNHARMWFASIWIFTLRLPWEVGADFFMRHLLDGDPASNTLSWRWVAGLHTRGKNYAAAAWNVEKFTSGQFVPDADTFAQNPAPLEEDFDYGPALPVRGFTAFDPTKPSALLLTIEDCHPESLGVSVADMRGMATLAVSYSGASETITAFDRAALTDAAARIERDALAITEVAGMIAWAQGAGATQIVTSFVPVGPTRDWLVAAQPALEAEGITLAEVQREWDAAVWPLATAGFFKVKKKIPDVLERLSPASA